VLCDYEGQMLSEGNEQNARRIKERKVNDSGGRERQ